MFVPGDPRIEELLQLAQRARGEGLLDHERPHFRELVAEFLGSINRKDAGGAEEQRQHPRAPAALQVDVLAPEELARLATSDVSAGGISLEIAEPMEAGTLLDLSIHLPGAAVPLFCRAQVVWNREGRLGAAFIDLFQNDRERIEALVVERLLAGAPA